MVLLAVKSWQRSFESANLFKTPLDRFLRKPVCAIATVGSTEVEECSHGDKEGKESKKESLVPLAHDSAHPG